MKIDTDHCYHHGYEPIPPNCYRVCVECGHAYRTADELLDEHNDLMLRMFDGEHQEVDAAAINICPLCTHDF